MEVLDHQLSSVHLLVDGFCLNLLLLVFESIVRDDILELHFFYLSLLFYLGFKRVDNEF